MLKKFVIAGVLALSTCAAAPVTAWELAAMNRHIDQTNFIVGSGCSGTLIDIKERLVLTNHHCITQFVKTETRNVVNSEGVISELKFERLEDVPVSQRRYTNFKVVASATWTGEIVARDETIDLALIQLRDEQLPQVEEARFLQDGNVIRGEEVFVVGNPLMLDAAVTRGVVSSVNRTIKVGRDEQAYYQIDAGMAPGNSGGALYNKDGLFIGVPAAGAQGTSVGLAIPITVIQDFLTENCFRAAWDESEGVQTYEECTAEKEEESEE